MPHFYLHVCVYSNILQADIALRNSVSHNIGLLKVSVDANGCGAVLTANNTYVVSGIVVTKYIIPYYKKEFVLL